MPSTVVELSVGQHVLKNIEFLVADEKVESEDLLIGLPVFLHLRVDKKRPLEENIESLTGTDYSLKDASRKEPGKLSRNMLARRHVRQAAKWTGVGTHSR